MPLDVRPNLIIAGAQKAGTTTLATRLAAHPQIFMPPEKELNFFTKERWYLEIEAYLQRYVSGGEAVYRLDATPGYLWTEREDTRFYVPAKRAKPPIPESIKSFLGSRTKILVILRHPSLRAISGFFHQFRMGRIGTADRIRNLPKKFGLVDIGFYSDHIANYRKVFSEDNMRVFFLEKYGKNKSAYDREIFQWLGLDPDAVADRVGKNIKEDSNANFRIGYDGRSLIFQDGIDQVLRLKMQDNRYKKMLEVDPPIVEPEDIEFLNSVYQKEISQMRNLYPETAEIWDMNPTLADY
ncbi:hypothetical protein DM806_00855 [Sphingobium lactosutens]|uniref:sulfotransferase domain-containing protein n=1 Tax=Sphingobium lactosutens TaxID=522773 RepID=UPI0015BD4B37|nr:sulfotransferase domain-containing protein [Sphingobium lactosutens]NWK94268.1 hypothetical protein [Sphingobium lactosutens]